MQQYAHFAEFEKCCRAHIFLQTFVLKQPITSPTKICKISTQNEINFSRRKCPRRAQGLNRLGSIVVPVMHVALVVFWSCAALYPFDPAPKPKTSKPKDYLEAYESALTRMNAERPCNKTVWWLHAPKTGSRFCT